MDAYLELFDGVRKLHSVRCQRRRRVRKRSTKQNDKGCDPTREMIAREVKVSWLGMPRDFDTWEPEEQLIRCLTPKQRNELKEMTAMDYSTDDEVSLVFQFC